LFHASFTIPGIAYAMLRIYGCIVEQHDLRLVVLAALICVFASWAAIDLLTRARQPQQNRRLAWSIVAAIIFGSGVWATHFIAELAYDPGLPLGYDIGLTVLSIAVAMVLTWLGFIVALGYDAPLLGGGIVGAAVAAMHYVGMAALRIPAVVHWDVTYVAGSLAAGILISAAAMGVLWSATALRRRVAAAGLLVAAICGLHFIGMAAVTLTPEPMALVSDQIVKPQLLAAVIAAVTALIIGLGLSGVIADNRLARGLAGETERLRKSEARLIDAIEAFPEGFALYDSEGRFVLCNNRYRTMYPASADLLQPGARFEDIIRGGAERGQYALGREGVEAWLKDRLERWARPGAVFEQRLATGEWIRIMDRRTSEGGIIGVREDITELKQREATFRLLFESNPLPMMVYDFKTRCFLEANDAAVAHYGYGRDQFLAMTIEQIVAAEEATAPQPAQDLPAAPRRRLGLARHRKADRSTILVEVISHQLTFRGHSAALMVAIDVTEKKHAEEALRNNEARLRKSERHLARAQELAEIGSFEGNLVTGPMVWSDNLYRMCGVEKGSFTVDLDNVLALMHPDDRSRFAAFRADYSAGGHPEPFAYRIVRPDGECRHHQLVADPIVDERGAVTGSLGTVRDVTHATRAEQQRQELQSQLQHSQRLEALGTLAGGIAHDLNNTLVPVLALSKLLMKYLPPDDQGRAKLATIHRAGERARDLVRQILAFSRKDTPMRQPVDVAALLRDSLKMIRASVHSTITVDEVIESVPLVYGDPGQLHQIVINLVVNAAQAIGGNIGMITVTLAVDPDPSVVPDPSEPAHPMLHLCVRDTGCGMSDATMQRVFEPFFTTKPVGEGTGLGLSIVHGIVTQHGGRMTVMSRVGEGTRFDVYLPGLSVKEEAERLAAAEDAA
jgi:PAS domain S-box-containing protein